MKRAALIAALVLLPVRGDAGKSTVSLGGNWEFSGEVSSPGGAGAVEINAELTPDNDAVPGQVSGDAYGLTVAPTVNISKYSVGPVGGNSHKWVASQRLYMPRLQKGGGTGKPQSLIGLMILDPPGIDTTQADALMEAWALTVGTKLPSRFAGSVQMGGLRIYPSPPPPASSSDPSGQVGDVRWDAGYLYVKTGYKWRRAALREW